MTVPALEAHDLYRFFRTDEEETLALRGVSICVDPGEVVAVIGPSGSGKSTLLSCLAGLDEPAGGQVRVAGVRISHRPETERALIRARGIGVMMQSGNLLDHLTVLENVRLAQAIGRKPNRPVPLDLVDGVGLSARSNAYPRQLSGGESARAGLAVALANDPAVLLADEPTGELDGNTEAVVLEMLTERAKRGQGVLIVTHSKAVVAVAHRVVELHDGRVLA